jgi:hypothetical protein
MFAITPRAGTLAPGPKIKLAAAATIEVSSEVNDGPAGFLLALALSLQ